MGSIPGKTNVVSQQPFSWQGPADTFVDVNHGLGARPNHWLIQRLVGSDWYELKGGPYIAVNDTQIKDAGLSDRGAEVVRVLAASNLGQFIEAASETRAGVVTTVDQTFAGVKTFSSGIGSRSTVVQAGQIGEVIRSSSGATTITGPDNTRKDLNSALLSVGIWLLTGYVRLDNGPGNNSPVSISTGWSNVPGNTPMFDNIEPFTDLDSFGNNANWNSFSLNHPSVVVQVTGSPETWYQKSLVDPNGTITVFAEMIGTRIG